ncbi:hypothetical protein CFN78_10475 [Amycolatopsis antarctica]|uniref:ABC3 transporter permease C-terminal domain-containing protein n=1 Tax=Amycolatopsis antarctica TaxID=1854586 RepID=A0A263D462_9PSEU|nr:FtsX-like permease family protein [Amycolatopsis antarctica]OZM73274.1 hypothetical protein CFN78_10475 [Amycolatopsis antarctica]
MLWIAIRTLRDRWLLFAGSFIALTFGVALVATTTLVISAAADAEPPESPAPGRFDAVAVVVRAEQRLDMEFRDGESTWVQSEPTAESVRVPVEAGARLASVDGVQELVPAHDFDVAVIAGSANALSGSGQNWSSARLAPYPLVDGKPPGPGTVVVADGVAKIGDELTVVTPAGDERVTVAGLVSAVAAGQPSGSPVFFADADAGRLSGAEGRVDAFGAFAAPGVAPQELASRLRAELPDQSWRTDTGATRADDGSVDPFEQATSDVTALMATAAVVAGFVSIFVVASTFAFTVAGRRNEIALLRTVGATPKQVRRMITGESVLVGMFASALGCALGPIFAPLLGDLLIGFGLAPAGFTVPTSGFMLLISFAVGVVVAVLGVSLASRRGAKVRPVEALRVAADEGKVMTASRWLIGLVFVAIAGVLLAVLPSAGAEGAVPVALVLTEVLVVALAALAPVFLPAVVWLAGLVMSRLAPTVGMLARENLRVGGRRTVSTAAPIMVTVAIAVSMLTIGTTIASSTVADQERTTSADVVVASYAAGISPASTERLQAVPGVRAVTAPVPTEIQAVQNDYSTTLSAAGVRPEQLLENFDLQVIDGSTQAFRNAAVVVDQETAEIAEWTAGAQVDVYLGDGTRTSVNVAAVVQSAGGLPGALLTDDLLQGHVDSPLAEAAYVSLDPGTDPGVLDGVVPGAQVQPIDGWLDMQADDAGKANRVVFLLLIGMALVYSGLAIANTLLMASGQRVRDVALLRLVGAKGRQITWMLLWETLTTIVVGVLLGAVAACVSVAGVLNAISVTNPAAHLSVPLTELIFVVVGCVAIALLASLLPAKLALRGRALDTATARQ